MGMFKLPRKTCKDMASIMSKFWWGHMQKESGGHWRKWRALGETKSQGGLDFKDFEAFNKSLIAKQICHLIDSPNSLAGQILKSKYYPSSGVLDTRMHNNPSLIWRSFHSAIDLIKKCLLWCIGDGYLIYI